VLSLMDNMKMSIAEKRDLLVQIAHGKTIAFVDDDDDVSDMTTTLMPFLLEFPQMVFVLA
jgi:hypothetical protein